jgi:hypothetical protein
MDAKRLAAAMDCCDPAKVGKLYERGNPQEMCCELQRIHEILSGRPYFDYDAQTWIDGDAGAPGCPDCGLVECDCADPIVPDCG